MRDVPVLPQIATTIGVVQDVPVLLLALALLAVVAIWPILWGLTFSDRAMLKP